jgi:hypothetical protein
LPWIMWRSRVPIAMGLDLCEVSGRRESRILSGFEARTVPNRERGILGKTRIGRRNRAQVER